MCVSDGKEDEQEPTTDCGELLCTLSLLRLYSLSGIDFPSAFVSFHGFVWPADDWEVGDEAAESEFIAQAQNTVLPDLRSSSGSDESKPKTLAQTKAKPAPLIGKGNTRKRRAEVVEAQSKSTKEGESNLKRQNTRATTPKAMKVSKYS